MKVGLEEESQECSEATKQKCNWWNGNATSRHKSVTGGDGFEVYLQVPFLLPNLATSSTQNQLSFLLCNTSDLL